MDRVFYVLLLVVCHHDSLSLGLSIWSSVSGWRCCLLRIVSFGKRQMIPARFMSEDVSLWNEDLRSSTPKMFRRGTGGGGGWDVRTDDCSGVRFWPWQCFRRGSQGVRCLWPVTDVLQLKYLGMESIYVVWGRVNSVMWDWIFCFFCLVRACIVWL